MAWPLSSVASADNGVRAGYKIEQVIPLGQGSDHLVYEAEGGLIRRFPKHPDRATLTREARLLAAVAPHCPIPVPQAHVEGDHLVYAKLPGRPLLDRLDLATPRLIATFAEALKALQAIPLADISAFTETEDDPPGAWLAEAAHHHGGVGDALGTVAGAAARREAVAVFLATEPPPAAGVKVFSHNDFGAEHLLVDPVRLTATGIIDFSDAAITDPATDFGRLYRDFGPAALTLTPAPLRERAVFYARCLVFEDLAYGLTHEDPRYVGKSLAALGWLFA